MIDYYPKLSKQALSVLAKTLSDDKLQKPFLRLLPKDHVRIFVYAKGIIIRIISLFSSERKGSIEKWYSKMLRIH